MARTGASRYGRSLARAAGGPMALEPLEGRVVLSTVHWDGGGADRLWSNPLNWDGDVVPVEADDVVIDLGLGVEPEMMVADLPVIRVNSLTLGDTLVVNRGTSFNVNEEFDILAEGSLRINGLVNWGVGVWDGQIAVRVHPGGLLNVGSSVNTGTGQVTLGSDLLNLGRLSWRGGDIILHGTITSAANRTLTFGSPGTISGSGSIINHGLLVRNGAADTTTTIAVSLTNTDRINLIRGTLSIGQDGVPTTFTDTGRLSAVKFNTTIRYVADSTHGHGRLLGNGLHEFAGGSHEFEGPVFLGLDTRFTGGAELVVGAGGIDAKGRLEFEGATITLNGDMHLRRLLSPGRESSISLTDTDVSGAGLLSIGTEVTIIGGTFDAELDLLREAEIRGATFNADALTRRVDVEGAGMAIGPGATFTNRGWFRLRSGRIDMAADAVFDKVFERFEIYGTRIGGTSAGEGTLILRQGELQIIRNYSQPLTSATITADVEFVDVPGVVPEVYVGRPLDISGEFSPLRIDPVTGLMTLHNIDIGGQVRLPHGVEAIGAGSIVRASTASMPELAALREVYGTLNLGAGTSTFSSEFIVNHGEIRKPKNGADVVITTPIDNREGGLIRGGGGTGRFEITGLLNASNQFVNHGSITGEGLRINVDQGQVQGTLLNLGVFGARATVVGSFENAAGGLLRVNLLGSTWLSVTRELTQGGDIYVIVYQSNQPRTEVPVVAASYSGEYDSVEFNIAGPEWRYLPTGALEVSWG